MLSVPISNQSLIPKSVLYNRRETRIPLLVHGQGVFLFEAGSAACCFSLVDSAGVQGIGVEFTEKGVFAFNQQTKEPFVDPKNTQGLSSKQGAFYWFSLDSQHQRIQAGIGEPRAETAIYTYTFPEATRASNRAFLESIMTIVIPTSLKTLRILRDPITSNTPLHVRNTHELTMMDIASSSALPHSHLSTVSQKLYSCISGKNFHLNDAEFPDFARAIQHSIVTPGLWCNKKLLDKSREFNPDKANLLETYLRITLNDNNGESPGIPYVMEIWPSGHYSPIHSHSAADAVIRVLHGSIHVSLYPFLCAEKDGVEPFGSADFHRGDITWISPTLNQTHQLKNVKEEACITIQCYMYEGDDDVHYDYFDYIDSDGNKKQYEPDSDMDFVAFRMLMKEEWEARVKPVVCGCFPGWK
jgi:hypothetical protein